MQLDTATGTRHPREMGAAEVESFLSWLAVEGQVSATSLVIWHRVDFHAVHPY
ncbi:phage integrase N-terminal SAM-like domain-containing protein [Acidithiobacillus ferrooxidans]|uniref:phage integrase N-terminal SAM-like domain-containing protein n=1 Tax=Acidithiobacillus ferrooxidans TaxID=920 RepID=UPI0035A6E666